MPGKGHNEAPNPSDPSDESRSGVDADVPSVDTVSDKASAGGRIAFWGRPKKPVEQGRKKSAGSDKNAAQRERSQEKSDGGLLFFPRRAEPADESTRTATQFTEPNSTRAGKADADVTSQTAASSSNGNFHLDRGIWEKQLDGAQWTAGPSNSESSEYRSEASPWIADDEFKYNPEFQSDWQKAEQAAWLDPESGVRDDRWDSASIKGDQERALERANERARIQERLRNNKIEMPEAPQKSWRSMSFTEAAGDKPDALKRKSYEEYAQTFRDASTVSDDTSMPSNDPQGKPSFDSTVQHGSARTKPDLSKTPVSSEGKPTHSEPEQVLRNPMPLTSPMPSAARNQESGASLKKEGSAKTNFDSTGGANEIRNWYLSKLKARSKKSPPVSPANRKREILAQITPGSSSLATATVVLGISLLLCVAASVCQALNMASVAQVLPGASALGIAIGAFMVFQSEQRFRKFKKEFAATSSAEAKELDELGLVEYLLKLQEYELAELREREQTFLDFTEEMLCTLDSRQCITYVNDSLLKSTGYTRDSILGKPFNEFIAFDEKERAMKSIANARSSRRELTFEAAWRRPDDSSIDLKWQVEYSENSDCYFCTARDISAQRTSERTQRQFLNLLDEEFKLPLTAVQGALSMLRIGAYGTLPEQVLIRAGSIEKTTAQLIRRVSDLVDLERIETGKMELRIDDFPISVITEQAIEAVQSMADQKHLNLLVKNNRTRLTADSERLLRVMVNLLTSGIYLAFENTSLLLEIEEVPGAVQVQVSSQGRSLTPAEQNMLFDRSKNTSLADATMSSAVIMAMSVSKGIVESHGGTLTLQSVEGKGTTIVCLIPKIQRQGVQGSHFG